MHGGIDGFCSRLSTIPNRQRTQSFCNTLRKWLKKFSSTSTKPSASKKVVRGSRPFLRNFGLGKGAIVTTLFMISRHSNNLDRRLDLTAPTRYMGARRLLKEGQLMKAKSGRKLQAFLCSDILVLTEDAAKALYRMVRSCRYHIHVRTLII